MDKIEYQKRGERTSTPDTALPPPIPFPSILRSHIPLSELPSYYYIPVVPRIEKHPYSRWLP
jgi:hypothetical protein